MKSARTMRPPTVRMTERSGKNNIRCNTSRSRKRRSENYFKTCSVSNFGKDAPKISIGSSRSNNDKIIEVPGPGAYDIEKKDDRKIMHQISKKKYLSTTSLTANIEYINFRVFPEKKLAYIHERDNLSFPNIYEKTPGPTYIPEVKKPTSIKIKSRYDSRNVEITPGPGSYSPNYDLFQNSIKHKIAHKEEGSSWLKRAEQTPSPCQYRTYYLPPNAISEPKYSIGSRSISSPRKNKPKNTFIVTVDIFLIHVDANLYNEVDSKHYVATHKEVQTVLHEVIEEMLKEKPASPISFLRNYFFQQQKSSLNI